MALASWIISKLKGRLFLENLVWFTQERIQGNYSCQNRLSQ